MTIKSIFAASALTFGLLGGGAVIANAATTATPTAAPTSSAASNSSSAAAPNGSQADGPKGQPSGAMPDRGANPNDTTITGSNADKATAAVVAKYSSFKVNLVQQDKDGSYDVHGTLNGKSVMYNVTTAFAVE